jgi:hypothetical protein
MLYQESKANKQRGKAKVNQAKHENAKSRLKVCNGIFHINPIQ